MTTSSNDNYSEVIDRNADYRTIANLFGKTTIGTYDSITDEEIDQAMYAIKLLRNEQIQSNANQLNLELK